MKKLFKTLVTKVLWWQVRRLRAKYSPKTIAVAGSVGKTSTKSAVAQVLAQKYSVAWQKGNYNDLFSIPLVFFMRSVPSLFNPLAWSVLFVKNELAIMKGYQYQVVVLELGTDHAGDMKQLEGVLRVDHTLLTAITPEHMQGFTDLDDVAKDELIAAKLADKILVDSDSVAKKYLKEISDALTISMQSGDCIIKAGKLTADGREVRLMVNHLKQEGFTITTKLVGKQNLPSLAFALLIGLELDLSRKQLQNGLESIEPFPGRMNVFKGKNGSLLIDDTYNSSPHALKSALDTLYEFDAKQKIAVLGQMNEMGSFSEGYHREAGEWCDPAQLALLVTLGDEANHFLAEEAERRGCKVLRCASPYQAAAAVLPLLQKDTVVLLKGSQGGIFLEEATKQLLADSADVSKLVRQSSSWVEVKKKQFSDFQ